VNSTAKCFDLDGFHHGEVQRQHVSEHRQPEATLLPLRNRPKQQQSRHAIAEIRIVGNQIQGMKYGGLFLIAETIK